MPKKKTITYDCNDLRDQKKIMHRHSITKEKFEFFIKLFNQTQSMPVGKSITYKDLNFRDDLDCKKLSLQIDKPTLTRSNEDLIIAIRERPINPEKKPSTKTTNVEYSIHLLKALKNHLAVNKLTFYKALSDDESEIAIYIKASNGAAIKGYFNISTIFPFH
jgi:hypothetical protein